MLIQYRNLIFGMGTPQPAPLPPSGGGGGPRALDRDPQIDPRYRGLRKAWPESILSESFVGMPTAIALEPGEEPVPAQLDRALPRRARKHLALVLPPPLRIPGPSCAGPQGAVGAFSVRLAIAPPTIADLASVSAPVICFHIKPATVQPARFELGIPRASELVLGGAGGPLQALGLSPAVLARAARTDLVERIGRIARVPAIDRIRKPPRK